MGFCQVPKSLITKRSWRRTRDFFPSLVPACPLPASLCAVPGTDHGALAHRSHIPAVPSRTVGMQRWHPPLQYHLSIIPLRKARAQKARTLLLWRFIHLLQAISLPATRDGDDFFWPPSNKGSASSWHQGCFLIQLGPSWQITALLCDSVSPSVHTGSDALSVTTARG